eukprot:2598477-Ditylum_brightwellii.AAC.1
MHLELEDGARPFHSKAYSVPHLHEEIFKKELKHLVKIGVLRQCSPTEWAARMFIISKKDKSIRWISDI